MAKTFDRLFQDTYAEMHRFLYYGALTMEEVGEALLPMIYREAERTFDVSLDDREARVRLFRIACRTLHGAWVKTRFKIRRLYNGDREHLDELAAEGVPEERRETSLARHRYERALTYLAKQERSAVLLRDLLGFDMGEIAQILEKDGRNVQMIFVQAVPKMRDSLADLGNLPEAEAERLRKWPESDLQLPPELRQGADVCRTSPSDAELAGRRDAAWQALHDRGAFGDFLWKWQKGVVRILVLAAILTFVAWMGK